MKFLIFLVLVWMVAATGWRKTQRPSEELILSCSKADGRLRIEFRRQCLETGEGKASIWRMKFAAAADGGLFLEWMVLPEYCRRV